MMITVSELESIVVARAFPASRCSMKASRSARSIK